MVNLNNIFNKFYPKSQTSPMGKKLIIMAWIIEITVALVGFSIAASFIILGNQEIATATGTASKFNFEFIIIGLAFFVVGIMELTKIPIATALYYAVKETWFVIEASWEFVISMFKGTGDTSQLGGPIKIAKITGQVAKFGIVAFLSIMAYISISLGFINLFPIPMLDGGHLMFYAFEKILGRPLTQRTQEGFFRIGLFLLLSLMFFTTFNDLKDLGLF